jgi:hypothetical protein
MKGSCEVMLTTWWNRLVASLYLLSLAEPLLHDRQDETYRRGDIAVLEFSVDLGKAE